MSEQERTWFQRMMKSDIVRGYVLVLASGLWVFCVRDLVPENWFGAVVMLAPSGVLLLTGAFFMLRGKLRSSGMN